jgi:hypothetical protein
MARFKDLHSYDPHHFLDRAFEYYVTGRFAALNNLQIAPNLFHHTVEMLAKFVLLRRFSADRLAQEVETVRKRYGHKLVPLWEEFKAQVGDPALNRFDQVIKELGPWEKLRYGGFPTGASITMVFMRHREPHESRSQERTDEYVVVLADVDELFAAMVAASSIEPHLPRGAASVQGRLA